MKRLNKGEIKNETVASACPYSIALHLSAPRPLQRQDLLETTVQTHTHQENRVQALIIIHTSLYSLVQVLLEASAQSHSQNL